MSTIQEENTTGRLDCGALRRAVELRDPEAMLGFYADDAQVRVLNGDAPRSLPFELRGRAEIQRYLRAVCEQEMANRAVEEFVVTGEERIAFGETCEYPDGTRIVVHTTLELRGGEIVGQVDVVVRNEQEAAAGEGGDRQRQ